MPSLEELVARFNALPREPQYISDSGLENHWHFSVTLLSYEPKIPFLFLFNYEASPKCFAIPLHHQSTAEKLVEHIIPALLEVFIGTWPQHYNKATVPWSWGTIHTGFLLQHLQARLESAGIRKELCVLRPSNIHCDIIQQTHWVMWEEAARENVATANAQRLLCSKCNRLMRQSVDCPGCNKIRYCSHPCLLTHRMQHEKSCHSLALGLLPLPFDPYQYFKTIAPTILRAQKLTTEIGLEFPNGGTPKGLRYPIRRLVATGKDTPANLATLFGKYCETEEIKDIIICGLKLSFDPAGVSRFSSFCSRD